MPLDRILRPDSTTEREQRLERLLSQGFYPITILPKNVQGKIPTQSGPALDPSATSLPKRARGAVDTFDSSSHLTGSVPWGPVHFVVLWKMHVRHASNQGVNRYTDDVPNYVSDWRRQEALLTQYLIAYIKQDPSRETLEVAIRGALRLIDMSKNFTLKLEVKP
ncbi:MAG: hypothetical protein WAN50_00610 [Minisyncoccia bacterium]